MNYRNVDDLGQSNQTSKCGDKINPKRTKSPSKTCRFSKYIDILQTPLSTLERSLSKKKKGDTVKNEKKEIQMQTSTQYQQTGSVKKDTGYLMIFISVKIHNFRPIPIIFLIIPFLSMD